MVYIRLCFSSILIWILWNMPMKKSKEQQKKEDNMILLSWADYSKQLNTYSILTWIIYIILFNTMLFAWLIIEMRKD